MKKWNEILKNASLALNVLLLVLLIISAFGDWSKRTNDAFAVRGTLMANVEIDGETHRFTTYRVMVSEFSRSENKEADALIGADEQCETLMWPDGSKDYRIVYCEAIDAERGRKVIKQLRDCGVVGASSNQLVGDYLLDIQFDYGASYRSGILDATSKHVIPTLTFN